MLIRRATSRDISDLARLLFLDAGDIRGGGDLLDDSPDMRQSFDAFADELAGWLADHQHSHYAFVAVHTEQGVVGMAWVALLPRVPRPGATRRLSADIQTVFVTPQHRGQGIGTALVDAAARHATELGAARVTVASSTRAVPMYARLGFGSSPTLLQRPAD